MIKRSSGPHLERIKKRKSNKETSNRWKTRNAESGEWKIKSSGGKIKKRKKKCVKLLKQEEL